MIANGIFLSKLSYLISLWGGCNLSLLNSLQILQNKAARAVAKVDWNTPTSDTLHQCGWLSVHQLVVSHTVLLVYKTLKSKEPMPLYNRFHTEYKYSLTSQARSGSIKQKGYPNLELAKNSFRWRGAQSYNQLPSSLKNYETLVLFKCAAKK